MKPIYLRIAGGIIAMLTVLLAVVITQPTKTPKQEPETPNEIIDLSSWRVSGDATIVFAATSNDTKEFNIESGDLTFSTEEDAHKFASRYGNALMKAKSISGYELRTH